MINSNVAVDVKSGIFSNVQIARENQKAILDYVKRRTRLVLKNVWRNKADAQWVYTARVMMQRNTRAMGAGGWSDNRSAFLPFTDATELFETFPNLTEEVKEKINALPTEKGKNVLWPKVEGEKNRFTSVAGPDYKDCVLHITKVPISDQYSLPKNLNGNNLEEKGLPNLAQSKDGYEQNPDGEILFQNAKIKPVEDIYHLLEVYSTPNDWIKVITDVREDSIYISKEDALSQLKADFNRRATVVNG